ncbi:MAG: twin-arginine translocase TatA/TatE family subunit [Anaerolineae bacterium]
MLFRNFGPLELVIVLALALLIFGPGRIGKLGSELGKAIRGFKREVGPKEPAAESAQDTD